MLGLQGLDRLGALEAAESITPTETKIRFLKWPGNDRKMLSTVWMPMPPKLGTRTTAVGARRLTMGIGRQVRRGAEVLHVLIEVRQLELHAAVVAANHEAEGDHRAGARQGEPAALAELLDHRDDQDRRAEQEADAEQQQLAVPVLRLAAASARCDRSIPNIDSEKVRNTLMLYMTTSCADVAVGVEAARPARRRP